MVSGTEIRNICPVPAFTTIEELALTTGSSIIHVKYDSDNDLVYWLENNNIYRGLSDGRYTSDAPCFKEIFVANGKLGRRSWLWFIFLHVLKTIPFSFTSGKI